MWTGQRLASHWVIGPMPDRPLRTASQMASRVRPAPQTAPRPVMATRAEGEGLSAHEVDVAIGIGFHVVGVNGRDAVTYGERAHPGLHRAGGGNQMTHAALGGTDRDLVYVRTHDRP